LHNSAQQLLPLQSAPVKIRASENVSLARRLRDEGVVVILFLDPSNPDRPT